MAKLPACSGDQVIKALIRLGFTKPRKAGKHQSLVRERAGKKDITVVPHSAKELPRGTLSAILKQANVTVDEFLGAL